MIQVSFSQLLEFYVLLAFGGALLLALLAVVRRRVLHRATMKTRVQCNLCGLVYRDATDTRLPECPQCGRRNQRRRLSSL